MTKLTSTHTVVNMEVKPSTFAEIAAKLREAGYDHAFLGDRQVDMSGIALVPEDDPAPATVAWKPMESAPRDGRVILLRWGEDAITPGFWVGEFGDKPESCGAFPWAFIDADSTEQNAYILNQAADNEYGPTQWAPFSAEIFQHLQPTHSAEDAEVGRRWREDSSLETWFPLTAEELGRRKDEVQQLRAFIAQQHGKTLCPACEAPTPSPAAMDEIALQAAQDIAQMWGHDRSHFVSKIQVRVMKAIREAQPYCGNPNCPVQRKSFGGNR